MPTNGKSNIPGFVPGMTKKEYMRIYMRNRRGPAKERPQVAGIEPGMTKAEKMKVYRRRYALSAKGKVSAAACTKRYLDKQKLSESEESSSEDEEGEESSQPESEESSSEDEEGEENSQSESEESSSEDEEGEENSQSESEESSSEDEDGEENEKEKKRMARNAKKIKIEKKRLRKNQLERERRKKAMVLLKKDPEALAAHQSKIKERNQDQKEKGNVSKYWKGPKGKALAAKGYQKKKVDPGKLLQLRIGTRISASMSMPVELLSEGSNRLVKYTGFKNSQDVQDHFGATFEPWMNWDNYGSHRLNGPRVWQIGHRIPLCKFNNSDPNDLKRCWSKSNLYAQDGKENIELNDTMPPKAVLESLRHVWPLAWNGVCP